MIVSLPTTLAPAAPFPLVLAQSREEEFVAPGVVRATYRLSTSDGPVSITIVAVDPQNRTVRIDSVLANDRMISRGETLSAMAKRTGAVAGVNADYFDIGNTNQPLNLVIRSGALLRTPSKRIVLAVHGDRTVKFERATFSGTVAYGTATVPLTTINEWPPQGGASFLTNAYGPRKDVSGVRVVSLVPAAASHLATQIAGTYRVASAASADVPPAAELAFGPAALAIAQPPAIGDDVTIATTLVPPLDDVRAAVGGGPLLLANGAIARDPFSPAPEERDRRFPVSGAGTTTSGELLLASIDGRQRDFSIGLTRPQFASLWLALGASDAMAFDSGGSSELVARILGEPSASVLGSPSDGEERAIADGLFIYSDAPQGPAARLVVRPREIVALPNVDVPVALALADDAGHALGAVHSSTGDVIHVGNASANFVVRARGLKATVAVEVVRKPETLAIVSDARDPEPGETVHVRAMAFDARARAISLGDRVRWTVTHGTFLAPGALRVAARDAKVVATVGGTQAFATVHVGRRRVPLDLFSDAGAAAWQFASVPSNTGGAVTLSANILSLQYDFTRDGRAAYANGTFAVPGEPQQFSVDVLGDGSGVGIRAAFVNALGERRSLTLAKSVVWNGWQTRTLQLPDDLNSPVHLVSLYAFDGLDGVAVHSAGTLAFRNASVTIAGTP